MMITSIVVMDLVLHRVDKAYFFISDANKILALTTSVFVFSAFKNFRIKQNRLINCAASTTFGILLLHACCPAIRRFLWADLFDIVGHYNGESFPLLYYSGVVIIAFTGAMFIDLLRQRFIEKPLFRCLDKYSWVNENLWERTET